MTVHEPGWSLRVSLSELGTMVPESSAIGLEAEDCVLVSTPPKNVSLGPSEWRYQDRVRSAEDVLGAAPGIDKGGRQGGSRCGKLAESNTGTACV